MMIWERYFYREIIKVFCLFLASFYFLYVLVDASSRGRDLVGLLSSSSDFFYYYLFHFGKRFQLIAPFALMIATIRTLCTLNLHNEIVALMAGGLSLRRILRPFFIVALSCVCLVYLNQEFFLPHCLTTLKEVKSLHENREGKEQFGSNVEGMLLKDGSVLLYQGYDLIRDRFYDLYWIKSVDDVYRIKYLYPDPTESIGAYVDHIVRNEDGLMEKVNSSPSLLFEQLGFEQEVIGQAIRSPEAMTLYQLWHSLPPRQSQYGTRENQVMSAFAYKLMIPWLCLLVVLAPIPFCIQFTRNLPVFFIFGASILCFITFITMLDASQILADSQVLNPMLAVSLPFGAYFFFFTLRYQKLH